jgi:hypothetical protein
MYEIVNYKRKQEDFIRNKKAPAKAGALLSKGIDNFIL